MAKGDDVVVLTVQLIRTTERACLVHQQDFAVWLPSSQFKRQSIQDKERPSYWTIYIPRWLAEKQELEYIELEDVE